MKTSIGKMFEKIIEHSSKNAKEIMGEEHIKKAERELEKDNWQELREKHNLEKKDIHDLTNYVFESLINYLNLQEKVNDLFEEMVKEKKINGETEEYKKIKQEWNKQKEVLSTFDVSIEKIPDEFGDKNLSPSDFVRKHNLGVLDRRHRNFLLDELTKRYAKKKAWLRNKNNKK